MQDTRSQDARFVLVDARVPTGEMTKSDRYNFYKVISRHDMIATGRTPPGTQSTVAVLWRQITRYTINSGSSVETNN